MTLSEALSIIDQAADDANKKRGASDEVVQALRFLRDRGIERKTLIWYWESLHSENYIGRSQNANAARNRIRWLLKMPG